MSSQIKFTDINLNKIHAPDKATRYTAENIPYLSLKAYPSGNKMFYYYRRIHGKPQDIKIGSYPQISLDKAVQRANEITTNIFNGKSPARVSDSITLCELFDLWIETKTKGIADYRSKFNKHLLKLKDVSIANITNEDLKKLHIKMKNTPYQANRVLDLISAMYKYARLDLDVDITCPIKNIKAYTEQARTDYMDEVMKMKFISTCESWMKQGGEKKQAGAYFYLLYLTGCRKGELIQAKWSDLNLDNTEPFLTIPSEHSKTDEPYTKVLSTKAQEILSYIQNESQYIFPNRHNTKTNTINYKKSWELLLEDANITGITIHSLRRTLSTELSRLGVALPVMSRVLGHKTYETTFKHYTQTNLVDIKKALEGISEKNRLTVRNAQTLNHLKFSFKRQFPNGTKEEMAQYIKDKYVPMTEEDLFYEEQWLYSQAEEKDPR